MILACGGDRDCDRFTGVTSPDSLAICAKNREIINVVEIP